MESSVIQIWKYPLKKGRNLVTLPNVKHVEVISVLNQDDDIVAYIKFEQNDYGVSECKIRLDVVFTGEEYDLPHGSEFIGTVEKSWLVFHVFARIE